MFATDIERCDVCGSAKDVHIHSAINMPISLSYCKECDTNGYITLFELLNYLANPKHNQEIFEDWTFIQENIRVILNNPYINGENLYSFSGKHTLKK